jgi:hypothetical protein
MENNDSKSHLSKEIEDYWQNQAILVMKNLNMNDINNNIFPVKYSLKGLKATNQNSVNNFELMEDLSI